MRNIRLQNANLYSAASNSSFDTRYPPLRWQGLLPLETRPAAQPFFHQLWARLTRSFKVTFIFSIEKKSAPRKQRPGFRILG